MSHETDDDMRYDPSNVAFTKWLGSKKFNYKTIDHYTKKALWIYWIRGDDEVELTDEEFYDNEDEVAETYLLRTLRDSRLMMNIRMMGSMNGTKICHRCSEWPTCNWREDGYCNGGNLPGAYHIGNSLHYQDLEWYEALEDSELKDEALRNTAIIDGLISDDESSNDLIMEYLVKVSKRRAFWSLNEDILKIIDSDYQYAVSIKEDTAYPCLHSPKTTKETRSIRRIQRRPICRIEDICMTRSSTNELFLPFKNPKREFRSSRRLFKTLSLEESRTPGLNLFLDLEDYSEEEEAETMEETMKQYMSKTRTDCGSGVTRPKIEEKDNFELKDQFLKEVRTNTFSGSDHEDANEHIEKVLKIVYLFHIPNITIDQVMLRAFPMSLTGTASRWLRNKPTGSITI
ncbi:hypothetical protein Tco_0540397 [Tanacetum coccineum]